MIEEQQTFLYGESEREKKEGKKWRKKNREEERENTEARYVISILLKQTKR